MLSGTKARVKAKGGWMVSERKAGCLSIKIGNMKPPSMMVMDQIYKDVNSTSLLSISAVTIQLLAPKGTIVTTAVCELTSLCNRESHCASCSWGPCAALHVLCQTATPHDARKQLSAKEHVQHRSPQWITSSVKALVRCTTTSAFAHLIPLCKYPLALTAFAICKQPTFLKLSLPRPHTCTAADPQGCAWVATAVQSAPTSAHGPRCRAALHVCDYVSRCVCAL